jgi:hypothetical protein
MFHSLCLMVDNWRICNLRTGSPKKFADLQFEHQSKEICRFVDLKKCLRAHLRKFAICVKKTSG